MMAKSDSDLELEADLKTLLSHQEKILRVTSVLSETYKDIERIESKYMRSRSAADQLTVQNLSLRNYRHMLGDVLGILKTINKDRFLKARVNRYIDDTSEA
jgi:hypothetical protein